MSKRTISLSEEGLLPEAVKQYPCLHGKSLKSCKEKDTTANAWEAVASKLDFIENGELKFYFGIFINKLRALFKCVALEE